MGLLNVKINTTASNPNPSDIPYDPLSCSSIINSEITTSSEQLALRPKLLHKCHASAASS